MAGAKAGDTVRVHYTGSFEDGSVFDSSREADPFEFELGKGLVVPGFEDAVCGMSVGETKEVVIQPEDAYGPHREDLVFKVERTELPPTLKPESGMGLCIESDAGETVEATVVAMTESAVTLDANHELAGKALTFEIELVEIVP